MTVAPSEKHESRGGRWLRLRKKVTEGGFREPMGRDSRDQPVKKSVFCADRRSPLVIE
jgi:hypothetical protein